MRPERALPGTLFWVLGVTLPIIVFVPVVLCVLLLLRGCHEAF